VVGYVARRLLVLIPTLLGVATMVFLLMRVVPGDPAQVIAGIDATREQVEQIRHQLGYDQSLWQQYVTYMGDLLHGDLGTSSRSGRPVLDEITERLPKTLLLAGAAMLVAIPLGVMLGIIAAVFRGRFVDFLASALSVFGISMPVYWSGLLLVLVFSVNLRWLPAAGSESWKHLILPTVTLAFFTAGFIARQTRSALLEVLGREYIAAARAKGAGKTRVLLKHALRTALLPIITIIGVQFGAMLSGAILIETVFAWPGMGRLLVESISLRDYAVVQGAVLLFAVGIVLVNLFTDLTYAYVDPRIRYD
jgi:ABC-type dipeptide/oligopeptide/nickel transport system permease component